MIARLFVVYSEAHGVTDCTICKKAEVSFVFGLLPYGCILKWDVSAA